MNGTGTEENPYIIMTADDLYSMKTSGGSEVYFSLGADIDFNNTPYAENFVPITINCKMFYGNGHVIRNINYSRPDSNASMFIVSCDTTIDNLKTENIRLCARNVFLFGNSGKRCNISLKHCIIIMNDVIILSQASPTLTNKYCLMHEHNMKVYADYCTFAIKLQAEKSYPFFSDNNVSHSQMKAEIYINSSANSGNSYSAFLSESVISDSYFFLKINAPESDNISSFDFSSSGSSFSSSYLVCEPAGSISLINWNGSLKSVCFYDNILVRKNNTDVAVKSNGNTVNLYALNTEQCKNPVYLRSIGFNCVGADE
ncbi:MAG: hypothetical protein K2J32_02485 [Ruminococcus sp.]|nr:hypothetical protein [Ruminococcus sp.]